MCGICGFVTTDAAAGQPEFARAISRMSARMRRRGPDDSGSWLAPDGRARFGFRRLSILDPSSAGRQPMVSGDGRSVLVFNGEIYNFRELRRELESLGVPFRSRTDTEVLLEALNRWGNAAIPKLNGMFAFAWYHIFERRLLLARDHAGIKPLYYLQPPGNRGIAFASQFNNLLDTPWNQPGDLRMDVVHLFLRLQHIPAPYTLFEHTYQLEPGHYLEVDARGRLSRRAWWTLPDEPEPELTGRAAVESVSASIDNAVRRQRVADVPVGVFLSGGIDSPLVSAVARRQTTPDLKAFSIGNPGWWQDESADAKEYARILQLDLACHQFDADSVVSMIDEVMQAQYEPLGDFSILPALLVNRIARDHVKVALSGDGGDELFFGYERPLSLLRNGTDFRWPRPMRMALYAAGKYRLGPRRSSVIVSKSAGDYYFNVNCRLRADDLRRIAPDLPAVPSDFHCYESGPYRNELQLANFSRRAEFYGQLQDCLKKLDMASMYHSLEVRVPLLDREVLETSLRVDPRCCMRNGTRKAVLRDILQQFVPPAAIPPQKRGFSVPLSAWLRGPLRPLVEDTLFAGDLFPLGLFDTHRLRRFWQQHLAGERDLKWGLWGILCLQWWHRTHNHAEPGPLRSPIEEHDTPTALAGDRVEAL